MREISPKAQLDNLAPRAGRGRIALAIRVRGSLSERARNRFKNARHVAKYVVVPKSQDTVVAISEPFIANGIARIFRMLPAVDLDNQAAFTADEIDDVGTNRLLTNKFMTVKTARPQPTPKRILRFSRSAPQTSGALSFDLISSSQSDAHPHPDCTGRCLRIAEAIRPLPASGARSAHRATP